MVRWKWNGNVFTGIHQPPTSNVDFKAAARHHNYGEYKSGTGVLVKMVMEQGHVLTQPDFHNNCDHKTNTCLNIQVLENSEKYPPQFTKAEDRAEH